MAAEDGFPGRRMEGNKLFRNKWVKGIAIAVAVLAVLLVIGAIRRARIARLADPFEGLVGAVVELGSVSRSVNASGDVSTGRRDLLYIPYAVKVAELKARPGDQVLKGGLIARYESSSLEAEIEKTETQLSSLNETAARAMAAGGGFDLSLLSSLAGQQSGSVQEKEQLESSYRKLTDAEGKLTYKAPFDGIVAVLQGRQGQELASTSASNPLIEVIGVDSWYATVTVSEFDISSVKLDMPATITVPALDDAVFEGKVSGIISSPVKSSGMVSYSVRVDIEGTSFKLKPGMSADVSIKAYDKPGVLLIPHGYAYDKDGSRTIIVKGADGRPEERAVRLGEEGDDGVEVLEGLSEGEEVFLDTTPEDGINPAGGGGLFGIRARMIGRR